ncbi:MAG: hypothetical protein RR064_03500, partial [Oscillospiraceae bacterium]
VETTSDSSKQSISNRDGNMVQSHSLDYTRGKVTDTDTSSQQLNFYFKTSKEAVEKIISGEIQPKTMGEVDTIVSKTKRIVNTKAERLANFAINQAKLEGEEHIKKCFARLQKQNKK